MENKKLINELRQLKARENYTLYDLSKRLDILVSTLERGFRTNRINRVYAQYLKEKIKLF